MARLCKKSWIDTYIEYTSNQESPPAFHLWAGLCIVSAAVGRSVFIPRIKYTIFPNLFVILVAGSAKCKKSTSIKIAEKILKSVEGHPLIFAQRITPEALIEALELAKTGGSSSGIIVADELSVFMGKAGTDGGGIIPLLTTLYDSPEEWAYHTKARGKEVLKNVTLTVMAGTTKAWLKSSIPVDSIAGGFASRIIFVYQETPSRPILFYDETPYEQELRQHLITDLASIRRELRGPMEFSPEAKVVAERWYEEEFYKVRDDKTDGYYSRKHDTMFKLAALLSICESSSRVISADNIKRALDMLATNEVYMETILESVTNTIGGDVTEKILELVRKYDKIPHSKILQKCWRLGDSHQINLYIQTLVESREIVEVLEHDNRTRYYRIKGRV